MPYFGFNPNREQDYLRYKSSTRGDIPGLEGIQGGREDVFDQVFANDKPDRFERGETGPEIVVYPKPGIVIRYPKTLGVQSPLDSAPVAKVALDDELDDGFGPEARIFSAVKRLDTDPASVLGYKKRAF